MGELNGQGLRSYSQPCPSTPLLRRPRGQRYARLGLRLVKPIWIVGLILILSPTFLYLRDLWRAPPDAQASFQPWYWWSIIQVGLRWLFAGLILGILAERRSAQDT